MTWLVFCRRGKRQIDSYPKQLYPHTVFCSRCHAHMPVHRLFHLRQLNRSSPQARYRAPRHFVVDDGQKRLLAQLTELGFTLKEDRIAHGDSL